MRSSGLRSRLRSCDRFLEFWNLVFMSYELHADGTLTPLPEQNIDTGLGLERAARIAQQVASVYDTDGFQKIMSWIEAESGVAYGDSPDATKAHRVLADHGRAMTSSSPRASHRRTRDAATSCAGLFVGPSSTGCASACGRRSSRASPTP